MKKQKPAPVVDAKSATTTPASSADADIAAKVAELERQNREMMCQNQELAAKVAAMEEEELAADFREAFPALQLGLAESSSPAPKVKNRPGKT